MAGSQQAPHTCRMSLQLHPSPVEQEFWTAPSTQGILRLTDILACCLPFLNLLITCARRLRTVMTDELELPVVGKLILLSYICINLCALLLMWLMPCTYRRHRLRFIRLDRLWRLVMCGLLTHPQTILGYGSQTMAVSKAALGGSINRALAVSIFVPTVMHVQQLNSCLPFRHLLPFQIGGFAVAVMWAKGLPCWLSPAQGQAAAGSMGGCSQLFGANLLTANSSGSMCSAPTPEAVAAASALQQAAEQACRKVHVLHVLLALPLPLSSGAAGLHAQRLCVGPSSFQLLFLYIAGLLLVTVPLSLAYVMESWAKSRWLKAKGVAVTSEWNAGPPPVHEPSSSSSSSGGDTLQQQQQAVSAEASRGWRWHHLAPLCVLLVLQLPWVVAEWLVCHMQGTCAPALGGRAFA